MRAIRSKTMIAVICAVGLLSSTVVGRSQEFTFDTPDPLITELTRNAFRTSTTKTDDTQGSVNLLFKLKENRSALAAQLYEMGYFQSAITVKVNQQDMDRILAVEAPRNIGRVAVSVNPGPRFEYGNITVSPMPSGVSVPKQPTGPVSLADLETYFTQVIDAWHAQGYLQARAVSQDIVANHNARKLSATVGLEIGPKSSFKSVTVPENTTKVKASKIRSIVGLSDKAPLDTQVINQVETRLRRTGAFSQVQVKPQAVGASGDTALRIDLRDRKPKRIEATAALSSKDGISLDLSWMHRNITQNADRLKLTGQLTHIQTNEKPQWALGVEYKRPAAFKIAGANLETGAKLGEKNRGDDRYRFSEAYIGAEVPRDDNTTHRLRIKVKNSRNLSVAGSPNISSVSLPYTFDYDGRDNRLNPTKGIYLALVGEPFHQIDQSVDGLKLGADVRSYFKLAEGLVLAGRIQAGHTALERSNADIDTDFLFFSGGANSVRGQSYESLGNDIRGANLSGAQGMTILSVETRKSFSDNLTGVVFADYGTLHPQGLDHWGENTQSHGGYGVGLRYNTTLGPIRLDIAHPMEKDLHWKSLGLYFGLGQAF